MKDQEIPIIEEESLKRTHQTTCNGCGGNDELKSFTFRSGWNAAYNIAWCKHCRAKIAAFLVDGDQQS